MMSAIFRPICLRSKVSSYLVRAIGCFRQAFGVEEMHCPDSALQAHLEGDGLAFIGLHEGAVAVDAVQDAGSFEQLVLCDAWDCGEQTDDGGQADCEFFHGRPSARVPDATAGAGPLHQSKRMESPAYSPGTGSDPSPGTGCSIRRATRQSGALELVQGDGGPNESAESTDEPK